MTLSEILSDFNLLINMMWSTESKALEKSISRQRTPLLVSNNMDILCVMSIIAAVVRPVFLNNTDGTIVRSRSTEIYDP